MCSGSRDKLARKESSLYSLVGLEFLSSVIETQAIHNWSKLSLVWRRDKFLPRLKQWLCFVVRECCNTEKTVVVAEMRIEFACVARERERESAIAWKYYSNTTTQKEEFFRLLPILIFSQKKKNNCELSTTEFAELVGTWTCRYRFIVN